jgi:hypothetical protein
LALALTLFLAAPERFDRFLAFVVPGAAVDAAAEFLPLDLSPAPGLAFLLTPFFFAAVFFEAVF